MVWYNLPDRAATASGWALNYSFPAEPDSPSKADPALGAAALVRPLAEFFAYCPAISGNEAALIEGLLRLHICSARLDAAIPAFWQDIARNGLTVAGDAEKQRLDHLFGLDGQGGLLGLLKRYRRMAERDLPAMPPAEQALFLRALLGLADALLPDAAGTDLWPLRGVPHALPLYLQALALIVLVRGCMASHPGRDLQAAIARHHAFLVGAAAERAPEAAEVLAAAAQALAAAY